MAELETCLPVSSRNEKPNLAEVFTLSSENLEFAKDIAFRPLCQFLPNVRGKV